MIKLIASDMDGTLLDDEKRLPEDFPEVLESLLRQGTAFAVASGRTYKALDHLFPEEYRDRISYICDNGACTVHGGKPVNVSTLGRATFEELLNVCDEIGDLKLVVCAENGVFHLPDTEEFYHEVGRYYKDHSIVEKFTDITGDIYKLAICDMRGTMVHGKPALDKIFGERLSVLVSGEIWMDVMPGGVSKGKALAALQKMLGVTRAETMVFGDYFNDVEMLMLADWSFCMENGHEDVKKLCRFTAPDNNHGGVTDCIKRYALV